MAQIQNERDLVLQAAPVRVVPPGIDPGRIPGYEDILANWSGLRIEANGNVFAYTSPTEAVPGSITMTAVRTNAPGTITWSVVEGTAPLIGSGDSRTIMAADVALQPRIRVRASVTVGPTTYIADHIITSLGPEVLLGVLYQQISESELAADLGARIDRIDGPVGMAGSVDARIAEERSERVTADDAIASTVTTLGARVTDAESGLAASAYATNGLTTRADLTDGELLAQATSILGLQASVSGVEGEMAAVQQDIDVLATESGHYAASYTLRVEAGGVVGGFGLVGQSGGQAGPTLEFAIRANKIIFMPPTGSTGGRSMFFYKTTSSTENGVVVPAGLYLDNLVVRTASLVDAIITTAKLQNASVDTLKVAGNAITVPYGDRAASAMYMSSLPGTSNNDRLRLLRFYVDASQGPAQISASVEVAIDVVQTANNIRRLNIYISGPSHFASNTSEGPDAVGMSCAVRGSTGGITYHAVPAVAHVGSTGWYSINMGWIETNTTNYRDPAYTRAWVEDRSVNVSTLKR